MGDFDIKYHPQYQGCLASTEGKRDVEGQNQSQDVICMMDFKDIDSAFSESLMQWEGMPAHFAPELGALLPVIE
jgi:hypothetical protein